MYEDMQLAQSSEVKLAELKERVEYAEQDLLELDAQLEADKAQLEGVKAKLAEFSDDAPEEPTQEDGADEQPEVGGATVQAALDGEELDNTQAALIQREANLVAEIVSKQMRKVALQRRLDNLRTDLATAQYDDGTGGTENVND